MNANEYEIEYYIMFVQLCISFTFCIPTKRHKYGILW